MADLDEASLLASARSLHSVGGLYELVALTLLDDHKELLVTNPPPEPPARRIRIVLELEADDLDAVATVFDDLAALATIGPFDEAVVSGSADAGYKLAYADAGPDVTGATYRAERAAWLAARRAWDVETLGRGEASA